MQLLFFEIDDHFGRHLEFLGNLHGDCPGLLVCYSAHIPRVILKISACYEKCPSFISFLSNALGLQWIQGALPVRNHGLGAYCANTLATSAFLASAVDTKSLQPKHL